MNCPCCGAPLTPKKPGRQGLAAPFEFCRYWKVLVQDKRRQEWIQILASSKRTAIYNAMHNLKYYPWVHVITARPISQRVYKSGKFPHAPRSVRKILHERELQRLIFPEHLRNK